MLVFDPNVIGGILIGSLVPVLCHGILIMQACHYFSNFPNDPQGLKLIVIVIWIGAIVNITCSWWGLYESIITNFGMDPKLIGIPFAFNVGGGFGAFVRSTVQSIYTYRMYKYSGSLYIPVLCWGISAYGFIAGILLGATMPTAPLDVQIRYIDEWPWLVYSILGSAAVADIAITVSLCLFLRKNRGKGLERTMRIIDKLFVWTIQTGLLTSVTAIAVIIAYAVNKRICITIFRCQVSLSHFLCHSLVAWLGLLTFLTNCMLLYPSLNLSFLLTNL
ncbi:hypothetical protein BDZ94DRAFT_421802 [Collybia nuda]|uniref:DUF6534 domain-containing protein n=1 Tax=Collybia nuda TaxID=64659 RepID=A0A9P5XSU5_9AGAR|nr:hypothetical protein BDZ94DRAFT_421802 [Collybia nuda]